MKGTTEPFKDTQHYIITFSNFTDPHSQHFEPDLLEAAATDHNRQQHSACKARAHRVRRPVRNGRWLASVKGYCHIARPDNKVTSGFRNDRSDSFCCTDRMALGFTKYNAINLRRTHARPERFTDRISRRAHSCKDVPHSITKRLMTYYHFIQPSGPFRYHQV
jgi:hypothetical protein